MSKNKSTPQNTQPQDEKHIRPGDIEGKLEVRDTRERRDGPGGN